MLYVNLISLDEKPSTRSPFTAPLFLAVMALVLTGIFYPMLPPWEAAVRALTVEERETVIATLLEIETHVPELAAWAEEVRDIVAQDAIPTYVVTGTADNRLVSYDQDSILISKKFFEADPIHQERAVLEVVLAINEPARLDEGELATVGD